MSILQTFFQANRTIARRMTEHLPQGPSPFQRYEEVILQYLNRLDQPVVLDVGGGRESYFRVHKPSGCHLICLDISPEQLAGNQDADQLILADATREIPLPDHSLDLVVSRAVMEHLESPRAFLEHSFRVLKPGGFGIHVFPCKFAPFAIINGMLPVSLSQKILFFFQPGFRGKGGFPAYYRQCYSTAFENLLQDVGFRIVEVQYFHSQSVYFDFFVPLFLLSALYEILTLPFKNLAAFLLVVAQKP